jgi:Putative auto-transporter adhesin, head GIN domain
MKKIAISLTLALVLLGVLCGCHVGGVHGSGVRKTEKRELQPFTAIDTTGAFNVEVTCQKPASFEIEGDDNILPLIETEVRNGVLHIRSKRSYSVGGPISLRITLPNLESIKASGAGKFDISDLKNDRFEVDTTGAAKVTLSGQSRSVEISSTGAGKIDAHNLRAEKADVNVTGAASVDLDVRDQLDVTVSGAGRVTYSGNPEVHEHVTGAGKVIRRQSSGA